MNKLFILLVSVLLVNGVFAQDSTYSNTNKPPKTRKVNLSGRSNDHLLIQVGITSLNGKPDSINTKGLSRSFNIYLMYDFPFKTDPRFSVGIGPGIGTDNIYFDKTYVDIKTPASNLAFKDVSDTNYFKRFKIATAWLEAPVELRFSSNPGMNKKSVKVALGAKVGVLLNAHTKGKNLLNSSGNTLNSYTVKEGSKRFFNTTRLAATARIGYGAFSLFGSYQVTPMFKEGAAPTMRPLTIGITISGL